MTQKGKRVITGISFEPDIFEWIEEGRGRLNRSKYLNHIMRQAMRLPIVKR